MKRRTLLNASIFGAVAGTVLSGHAVADKGSKFAGAVYYTADNPGRWDKKVAGHSPVIQSELKGGKKVVTITTPHEMVSHHFIAKHTLFDEKMNVLGEKVFDPAKDKAAISSYTLDSYEGKVYAVSICNKHDTWLAEASV